MSKKFKILLLTIWCILFLTYISELFFSIQFDYLAKLSPLFVYIMYTELERKKYGWNNLCFWYMAVVLSAFIPFLSHIFLK